VYLYWVGTDIHTRGTVFFQARSFDGGVRFEKETIVARLDDAGLFDPNSGRFTFDGLAGARTSTFPSVDIANGAPTGADATDEIVIVGTDAQPRTPSDTAPGPNERVLVRYSVDGGRTFVTGPDGSPPQDRPDFPAVAIAPDGSRVWLVYDNFLQPWQSSTLSPPRLFGGVVRTASVGGSGAPVAWTDRHRGAVGDARGSSANSLVAEFLGDYNYAFATRQGVAAVWNDGRNEADCPAVDRFRRDYAAAVLAGVAESMDEEVEERRDAEPLQEEAPTPPAPQLDCPATFGNSDIFGGFYTP
jgi:hypothetical protein